MPDFLISTCNSSQKTIKKQVGETTELIVIKYFLLFAIQYSTTSTFLHMSFLLQKPFT